MAQSNSGFSHSSHGDISISFLLTFTRGYPFLYPINNILVGGCNNPSEMVNVWLNIVWLMIVKHNLVGG